MMWPCPNCGIVIRVKPENFPVYCRCGLRQEGPDSEPIWPKKWQNCTHRGERLRLEICEGCGDGTKIKVFSCTELAECTTGKEIPDIACCTGCKKFDELQADSK